MNIFCVKSFLETSASEYNFTEYSVRYVRSWGCVVYHEGTQFYDGCDEQQEEKPTNCTSYVD